MLVILAESLSDADTLAALVRRITKTRNLPIHRKGFRGKGDLLNDGPLAINDFANHGATRFIICIDADAPTADVVRSEVEIRFARASKLRVQIQIVVPVQELEAWILADLSAVKKVFPSWKAWKPKPFPSPERVISPKEVLIRLSHDHKGHPRYVPRMHNPRIAKHLELERVRSKCPSFQALVDFVKAFAKS